MQEVPQKEHEWLQQLVGEWTFETECSMGPDQPPSKFKGTETVRSLGGLWILCEGHGEMPGGGTSNMLITLGYDPVRKRYVGTFVGSMMTHLWIYDGAVDAAGKVLTLDTEGPSFTAERKLAKYQDVIEIKSHDHHVLTSRTPGPEGAWHTFMTGNYRRQK